MKPFYAFYDVAREADDAIAFILMARRLMWVFAAAILGLTFWIGKSWRDPRTGLVATVLLSYTAFFLTKSLEFRPAVPATAFFLAAMLLALTGVRRAASGERGGGVRLLASGLFLGTAVMFTQKVLFVGPGFALVTLWLCLDARLPAPRAARVRAAALQAAGFVAPIALSLAWFASKGGLYAFIDSNLLINARWPGLGAGPFLVELVQRDPVFVLLGLAGLALGLRRALSAEGALAGEPVLFATTLSLVATLPLHPGMSYQHFLLILPLVSLYAAEALVSSIDTAARSLGERARAVVLVPMLLGLGVVPLQRFREAFDRGNWGTLQAIRYVTRNASPYETTFDGFTGLGGFRPQPFFHHFQHPHAFLLQTEAEHQEILDGFTSGKAMPKMVFWSHYLEDAVTPEIAAFIQRHYVPSGIEPVLVRPFDNGVGTWSDTGPRYLGWSPDQDPNAPHVLYDDAWRTPSTEFGAEVRRTRTRRSTLTVPIRRPRDFDVVFRAHAEPTAGPFAVELVVNGHGEGVVPTTPRWQDYTFSVPVQHLIPGFNVFELRFSAEDDSEVKRLELAVNYLELIPSARE